MQRVVWLVCVCFLFPQATLGVEPVRQAPATFQLPSKQAPNVSIVTHGWNNLDPWPTNFAEAIETRVMAAQWQVYPFYWREQAGNIVNSLPHTALFAASYMGEVLGQQVIDRGYGRVHLYGHSAGGELAATAANYIKRVQPMTTVQLTLLDPYTPGFVGLDDGQRADWADNYFTEDSLSLLSYLAWTDHPQRNAFNVDNSELDPLFQVGHVWEHEWYENTITDPEPENQGFGFPLSLEAQGSTWNPAAQFQKGRVVAIGGTGSGPYEQPVTTFRQSVSDFTKLQIGEQSATGVSVTPTSLNLTGSSWLRIFMDTAEEVNSLRFTADFISGNNTSQAAVYWDDEPVRFFEERLSPLESTEYVLYLSEEDANRHELAIRLDGPANAMFTLSNVQLEFVSLAELDGADYDRNGRVDGSDFLRWQRALGTSDLSADGNNDGKVDGADLAVWKTSFGSSPDSMSAPEPATILGGVGVLIVLMHVHRASKK